MLVPLFGRTDFALHAVFVTQMLGLFGQIIAITQPAGNSKFRDVVFLYRNKVQIMINLDRLLDSSITVLF